MVLLNTVRSSRNLEDFQDLSASCDSVGPGSYSSSRWSTGRTRGGAGAGSSIGEDLEKKGDSRLQTLGARVHITKWHTKFVTPGPGAYSLSRSTSEPSISNPGKTHLAASLCTSPFRARASRLSSHNLKEPILVPGSTSEYKPSTICDNPGPGQYEMPAGTPARPESCLVAEPGQQSKSNMMPPSKPSIPAARDDTQSRYTGRGEDVLGPGDYDHDKHSSLKTVLRANGPSIDFHASTSQRDLYPPQCSIDNTQAWVKNPGPGTYNLRRKFTKGISQPFQSKTPQQLEVRNQNPGPGTYLIEETEMSTMSVSSSDKLAFSGLRSTSSRDGFMRPALTQPYTDPDHMQEGTFPGPGTYAEQPTVFVGGKAKRARSTRDGLKKKYLAVHNPRQMISLRDTDAGMMSGFQANSDRPCLMPLAERAVTDPGQYNNDECLGQSLKEGLKEPQKVGANGVFASTKDSDRFHGWALEGREGVPDPTHYQDPGRAASSTNGELSKKSFKSGVPRFPPDYSVDNLPKPDPGHYEAFDKVNYQSKFRKSKTDHLSFGSCQHRAQKEATVDTPGPGEYQPKLIKRHVRGAPKLTAGRKLEPEIPVAQEAQGSIGPGSYDVSGSMLRKTFNTSGARAAHRALSWPASMLEPPSWGGGAGGGVAGTAVRLAGKAQGTDNKSTTHAELGL